MPVHCAARREVIRREVLPFLDVSLAQNVWAGGEIVSEYPLSRSVASGCASSWQALARDRLSHGANVGSDSDVVAMRSSPFHSRHLRDF